MSRRTVQQALCSCCFGVGGENLEHTTDGHLLLQARFQCLPLPGHARRGEWVLHHCRDLGPCGGDSCQRGHPERDWSSGRIMVPMLWTSSMHSMRPWGCLQRTRVGGLLRRAWHWTTSSTSRTSSGHGRCGAHGWRTTSQDWVVPEKRGCASPKSRLRHDHCSQPHGKDRWICTFPMGFRKADGQLGQHCSALFWRSQWTCNGWESPTTTTTDAAVGNRPDLSSTGGYIIGMASKEMLQGRRGYVNPLSWRSGKLPCIARSSLAAEVQSLAEGEQELMMLRFQWAEILGIPVDLRKPHLATCQVPNHINQKDSTIQQCKFTLYVKISWPNGTSHITNGLSLLPKWGKPCGQSDGERPKGLSRDICTMTTLPLGASMEDLDGFHASHLDVPLVDCWRSVMFGEMKVDSWMFVCGFDAAFNWVISISLTRTWSWSHMSWTLGS